MPEEQEETAGTAHVASAICYKFQRLRDSLRTAILSGELTGQLPGERSLAKQFHVNAKTLSKAITELVAEGLLERTVGVGTFAKGCAPEAVPTKRWLVLCDADGVESGVVRSLKCYHADLEILTNWSDVRPSFLNRFGAIIILSNNVSQSQIFDLILRNARVILVGFEPLLYSTHAVLFDRQLAVSVAARELIRGGHRRFAAVEQPNADFLYRLLHRSVESHRVDATVETCGAEDVLQAVQRGVTAYVCSSVSAALIVKSQLNHLSISVPDQASVLTVSVAEDTSAISGFFFDVEETAKAILGILESKVGRPSVVWIPFKLVDRGTASAFSDLR